MTTTPQVPVLIVDDNPSKRMALKSVLTGRNYLIVEASSGMEALRAVMERDFAVILLDVKMPGIDGFETAALIRRRRQSEMTPIIFITAYAPEQIAHSARYVEGAVDFMFAPVQPDELGAKVGVFAKLFTNADELATKAREVQSSADHLRLLTEAAPVGIFHTDAQNMYVYTNPRWTEITGVTSEQAAGKDWDTAVGAVARPDLIPEPLNGTTDPAELSKHYEIRAEGSPSRIVLLTARTIEDDEDGVVGWVGTLLDVTAEIGADAALSDARDQATEASRLKSDFLANMSHEIRTPMNGVIGMTDLLLETDLDARQRDYALTVRTSGEAMVTIINDILDFSKVEAGKLEIEDVEFNLRTVVGDVVDLLAGPARSKGLELRSDVEDSVPAHVGGDPGRVRQVLINLIGNAIKFTQRGEIVIRARELKVEGKASIVRFEVSDTGDGIDPKKLKTIFQPFVQADTSTSRKYGGTGLGLAISGQLVALMGGDCGVSSKLGKGSDFWFTISIRANPEEAVEGSPQADSDPANSQWSSNDLMEPTPFVPTIVPNLKVVEDMGPTVPEDDLALIPSAETAARVLLVEDHPVNQRVASAMIESLGYEVDLACDGAAAVKIAQSTPYLAILMDCQMPILDGYEATRQIRELEGPRGSTPIIAVTASAMKIDEDRCLEAGMDDYMAKPLTLKALGATLSRWIPGDDSPGGQHDPSTRPPHDFPVPTQLAPLQATS